MAPRRVLGCVVVLGVALAGCGGGNEDAQSPQDASAVQRQAKSESPAALRAQLGRCATGDRFAGAVLVARSGEVIFNGAYGLADREDEIPNTPATRFRIGSMNKMFTAVAVLQLVQAGRIALHDPLGTYLADYPNRELASKVTIHHLLTHTGGTGDIFGPQFDSRRLTLRTLKDYVRLYGRRSVEFEPGSSWAYSNYGFILLGAVIEKVTGVSYYDYVRRHVYRRAGMTATGSEPEDQVVANLAVGYTSPTADAARWRPNTETLPYRGTSAGGGYSTVGDLLRFAHALQANRLLNSHYTKLLTTGKAHTPGEQYAYGFSTQPSGGGRSFGHGGGAPGMNGELAIYPDTGYVVATLSNLDPPAATDVSACISQQLTEQLPSHAAEGAPELAPAP